jgi:maltooligosyltrehalose trehalohydrolase
MPLAGFPGSRNWGYDGVLQYAPAACYGSPHELKAFIETAHCLGIMVFLDVVYNHFGPDGNYLHAYCPEFFNSAHRTPWGSAINFDGAESRAVRDFFVHNALYWIEEYRFDGLRMDAVHALRDSQTPDIVCEIARALGEGPGRERHVHLVLENNRNQTGYLARDPAGRAVCATAQWDDDVHHALHVLLSGESDGYYADYARAPLAALGRSLAEGFAYQGEHSMFRDRPRGELSGHLPPTAFVGFLQNHDIVGNRAFGDRIQTFSEGRLLTAAYVCLLLTPQVPLLFMGEEFAASAPFLFFCDFGPDLGAAVSEGRRREFKRFAAFGDDSAAARIPDPGAPATFAASKLNWKERDGEAHRERLELIRMLLGLRRRYLMPHLACTAHGGSFKVEESLLRVDWELGNFVRWTVLANFGPGGLDAPLPAGRAVFEHGVEHVGPRLRIHPGGSCVSLDQRSTA